MDLLTNLNFKLNQALNLVLHLLTSTPTGPTQGQVWFRTDTHRPNWYDGTAAQDIYPFSTSNANSTGVLRDGSGNFAANVITANTVTGLTTPSGSSDAASKGYVDGKLQGFGQKSDVVVTASTNVASLTGLPTLDGVTLVDAQRVLLTAQTTASQNGLWLVHSGAWTRPTDYASGSVVASDIYVFVQSGTSWASTGWVMNGSSTITVDTSSSSWSQFSGAGEIAVNGGILKSGNTLAVATASSSRITVGAGSSGTIDLATTGVTAAVYTSVTVDIYGRVTAGTNPTTLKKYTALIGDGSSTSIAITQATHGCASDTSNIAQVYDASTNALVLADITVGSGGTVTFGFATAPASNAYRAKIVG
jgi:hypothetical protein